MQLGAAGAGWERHSWARCTSCAFAWFFLFNAIQRLFNAYSTLLHEDPDLSTRLQGQSYQALALCLVNFSAYTMAHAIHIPPSPPPLPSNPPAPSVSTLDKTQARFVKNTTAQTVDEQNHAPLAPATFTQEASTLTRRHICVLPFDPSDQCWNSKTGAPGWCIILLALAGFAGSLKIHH